MICERLNGANAAVLAFRAGFVAEEGLANIEILEADAYDCAAALPDGTFDLVHTRFVFAPVGRDAQLLAEMWGLGRTAGSWPSRSPEWARGPPGAHFLPVGCIAPSRPSAGASPVYWATG